MASLSKPKKKKAQKPTPDAAHAATMNGRIPVELPGAPTYYVQVVRFEGEWAAAEVWRGLTPELDASGELDPATLPNSADAAFGYLRVALRSVEGHYDEDTIDALRRRIGSVRVIPADAEIWEDREAFPRPLVELGMAAMTALGLNPAAKNS